MTKNLIDNFLFNINEQFEKNPKDDFLSVLRNKDFEIFNKKDILKNNFLNRLFDYSFINDTANQEDKESISNRENSIIFLNGSYLKNNIFDKNIEILDLNKAMQKYPLFLQKHFLQSLEVEKNIFCLLNTAFLNGIYINIKENTTISNPINIYNIITKDSSHKASRIFINVEKNVNASVNTIKIEKNLKPSFFNQLIDINLNNDSNLSIFQDSNACENAFYFDSIRAKVEKKSNLKIVNLTKNIKNLKQDYNIDLLEQNAGVSLYFLSHLINENQISANVKINHLNKETNSLFIYKSILNENSKFYLESNVYMNSIAKLSKSNQINKNIILDDLSTVTTKPNLEVFTDDVIATHGATTSNLDGEDMFYLKTRGFNEKKAQNILIFSFIKEILEQIEDKNIKEEKTKNYL
ncbi:MAG: FeS cluster assembly protein SufD [Candidatus Anoxychlamydiales bacterium]|nr:FeS cluster assembly protein SufD [Candidatus Anoxychlamydiales bacterium]